MERPGRDRRARPRPRPAGDRRRQARRRRRHREGLRAGLPRRDAEPIRRDRRPRRRRDDGQPPARTRLARAVRDTARAHSRGLFVLVRTSNPGAADVQERALADGTAVSEHIADLVADIGAGGVGTMALSDVGAVVGATAPERLAALRERMPHAAFLLPGVGAQGGNVEELAPAFAPGPAGGLIAASRGIVAAHERPAGIRPSPRLVRRLACASWPGAWRRDPDRRRPAPPPRTRITRPGPGH